MWNGSAWSALGSDGSGDGALNDMVVAFAVSGTDLYVGGGLHRRRGHRDGRLCRQVDIPRLPPEARRLASASAPARSSATTSTTRPAPARTAPARPRRATTITFGISIQNDGTTADSFKVKATGTAASGYTVKYFRGTTDITAAVVAGTYKTTSLAPAATYLITAKVTVKSTAAVGSSVTRLVTLTSVGNGTKKDAVKFIGKRA